MRTAGQRADILLVVDQASSCQLLTGVLEAEGYEVRSVASGELALPAARRRPPDLVLLSVDLPEINGYEVCRALKADEALADIPVIFVSSSPESMDKGKAFDVGGLDYLAAPFQTEEIRARVQVHLGLHRLQLELEDQNCELQASYDSLRDSECMRERLTDMVVHDLRSPLSAISASLYLLKTDLGAAMPEESREDIELASESCQRLVDMTSDLLDISRMQSGDMPVRAEAVAAESLVETARTSLGALRRRHEISVHIDKGLTLRCDPELIRRVVVNLLMNAIRSAPFDSVIRLSATAGETTARFSLVDRGPVIPEDSRESVFEKFGRAAAQERTDASTGLGLAFCKLAVETHGGRIGVDSSEDGGCRFWFELPLSAHEPGTPG